MDSSSPPALARTDPPLRRERRFAGLAMLAAVVSLGACAGGGTEPGAVDRVLIDRSVDTTLFASESVDLRAVAVDDARREIVALTRSIEWTSDAPAIADVDRSTGVVVARAPGIARVKAAAGGAEDVVTFRVTYAVALVEVVLPDGTSLNIDDEFRACAVARAANGEVIAGVEPRWSVSDRAVLALAETQGRCTTVGGLQQGSATVVAEVGGKRGQGTVRVLTAVTGGNGGSGGKGSDDDDDESDDDDDDDDDEGNGNNGNGNGNGNGNNGNGNGNGGG